MGRERICVDSGCVADEKRRNKSNFRFAARRVPETDDFNGFHFILYAVENPIRLGNDFADAFIVLFGDNAAKARKFCQMPDACNEFSAEHCRRFQVVIRDEADNAFEVVKAGSEKIIL